MKSDDVRLLEKILSLETEKGYTDSAVMGGMDSYVAVLLSRASNTLPAEVKQSLLDLSATGGGYSTLDRHGREQWVTSVLAILHGKEAQPVKEAASTVEKMESCLRRPVTALGGIRDKNAEHLVRLGIQTLGDFLYLLPNRYLDYTRVHRIDELQPGIDQTVLGTVTISQIARFGNRPGTEAHIADESGTVRAVWFNQPWISRRLQPGNRIVMSGPVGVFKGFPVFESPEWERVEKSGVHTARLVPVYPLTRGLYARRMREWVSKTLEMCLPSITEYLPADIVERHGLLDLPTAIRQAHFPDDLEQAGKARQRLAFDELLALQLGLLMARHEWQETQPGIPFLQGRDNVAAYVSSLPFSLTQAQEKALEEVLADLGR
ncbi:MAG: DNA helicase RecG, partial [Chloroflexota bacterium]